MQFQIPELGKFVVDVGIEDYLPRHSASGEPDRSEDVIVLLMRQQNRPVDERRRLRVTENRPGYQVGFVLSEGQARELAGSLLSEADNLAKKNDEKLLHEPSVKIRHGGRPGETEYWHSDGVWRDQPEDS